VGEVWDRHFFIQRTGDEAVFMTARGPDVYYQGTVAGDDFTAEDRGGRAGPGAACGLGTTYYGRLSGRVSEENGRQRVVADEFWAVLLSTGGEIRWIFELDLTHTP
jgi:hypothetical protein